MSFMKLVIDALYGKSDDDDNKDLTNIKTYEDYKNTLNQKEFEWSEQNPTLPPVEEVDETLSKFTSPNPSHDTLVKKINDLTFDKFVSSFEKRYPHLTPILNDNVIATGYGISLAMFDHEEKDDLVVLCVDYDPIDFINLHENYIKKCSDDVVAPDTIIRVCLDNTAKYFFGKPSEKPSSIVTFVRLTKYNLNYAMSESHNAFKNLMYNGSSVKINHTASHYLKHGIVEIVDACVLDYYSELGFMFTDPVYDKPVRHEILNQINDLMNLEMPSKNEIERINFMNACMQIGKRYVYAELIDGEMEDDESCSSIIYGIDSELAKIDTVIYTLSKLMFKKNAKELVKSYLDKQINTKEIVKHIMDF